MNDLSPARPEAAPGALWRWIALACGCAIVLLALAWEWRIAPLRPGGSLLVLKALPLAWLLPGMARGRVRSFQAGSMMVLLYVAEGVVRGMTDAPPASTLGWIELALAGAMFVAILAHVRSLRPAPAALPAAPPVR